ncbi:MAG: T9SS type A sorting domain-containing protein [Ignavibacteria bacterium]|nr:T9SS type A sorting domain-containing protein [Ignavibacteria bacterium]
MKKIYAFTFIFVLFTGLTVFAQTDIGPDTKINMPNDWGKLPGEVIKQSQEKSNIPDYLIEQFKRAKLNRDENEKLRVGQEIEKYLDKVVPVIEKPENQTKLAYENAPFNNDWNPTDINVYSGSVAYQGSYRQLDLKRGEDGWMYLAVNRRDVSGYNGVVTVYRSSNGGLNWGTVITAQNTTAYFGGVTMLVEKRHATIDDSTRIIVYYTRSGATTFNDAYIECLSVKRNGGGAVIYNLGAPAAGNKYEFPTACSDGMYWDAATYMHLIVREATNAGAQVGLRHYLSTNWCVSHTNILINTGYNDYYPSAAYCEKGTLNDSIYIAIERRFSTDNYGIRAIITCEWLTTNHYVYYITTSSPGIKYEKPCITVQQQHASVPRRILITCTKNKIGVYHNSANGGSSWGVDYTLGGANFLSDFTWCNSDSLSAGDGYFIACYVDTNGDSITLRRGIIGSLGTYNYKINKSMSTGYLTPVCAIYKSGTLKYSAYAYAGQGPLNVYYNQEHLPTFITPVGTNIPVKYSIDQNYPNPFNPSTTIRFAVPENKFVKLYVFDMLGRKVAELVNEELNAGTYDIKWDASAFTSGVYFYKLQSGNFEETKRMLLIK